ncbi:MAG: prepilin-type N-terminal cleavage/methylation domain-containing protein [Planctomycetota bacterium]|jgi:prepilin-type N-terminal cleavage/methylation domain-containing protein
MDNQLRVARCGGFTLIELMVVIGIIGALAAVLMGAIGGSQLAANVTADGVQLRTHAAWFKLYERKHGGGLPMENGHRFVLATWTSELFHHAEEELDVYFSPGARDNDPDYRAARDEMEVGRDPWPTLAKVSSRDTHYAGRAKAHVALARRGGQFLMATDNEGLWRWEDGTVNALLSSGRIRSYSYQDLAKRFGIGPMDPAAPIATYGAASPIPECRKLAN